MLGSAHICRTLVFCLGLSVCTAAWLAVMADGPSASEPSKNDKQAAPSGHPANATERPSPLPGDRGVESPVPRLSSTEEAVINEIMQIRREQGGLLDGTLLEELSGQSAQGPGQPSPDQDAEFARALRGVAAAAVADPKPDQPPLASPSNDDSSLTLASREDQPAAANDLQLIDLLRTTARRLDSRAADFEDADGYRQAKRCRATAKQLRRLARELKAVPSP